MIKCESVVIYLTHYNYSRSASLLAFIYLFIYLGNIKILKWSKFITFSPEMMLSLRQGVWVQILTLPLTSFVVF